MKKVKRALSRVLRKKATEPTGQLEGTEQMEAMPEPNDSQVQAEPNGQEVPAGQNSNESKNEDSENEPVEKKQIRVLKTAKQLQKEREMLEKSTVEVDAGEAKDSGSGNDADVAENAEVKPEKKRPRRRKRSTKKKVEAKVDDSGEEGIAEKAVEDVSVKKDETQHSEADSASAVAEGEEEKPVRKARRRRRPRGKKDKDNNVDATESVAEATGEEAADDSAEEVKPRKRQIKSKEPVADNEAGEEAVVRKLTIKARSEAPEKKQRREMLINVTAGQECRIAVIQERKLEELYVERLDTTSLVGNIYKGKIVNVEPSIQACFVDFGIGQNGFLHISDVQTSYFKNFNDHSEKVGKKQPRKDRPLIQECLKKGQEVVVQVIKAGIGTKGPTLSSYISIPGRYVVLMPGMRHSGVSRKLSQEDRQKMKELSAELSAPDDVGIILRTASLGSNKRDLKKDFAYLIRLWKHMSANIKKKTGPMELYKESDLVIRTIRDIFTNGIDRIYCDNEVTWGKINDFFTVAMPRSRNMVKLYNDHNPIFSKYNIEKEIEKLQSKNVPLANGGSIVIESTEAMVTIDVNSGKYRDNNNAEDTAYKTNMEAADEICRQLKLRDLGGMIVIDFIDMVNNSHKRDLEKLVKDLFLKDRASTRILRINQFGLMAITRQRMKASLKNRTYVSCPLCKGAGQLKSSESVTIEVMRKIAYAVEDAHVSELDVIVSPQIAEYLLNDRRHALVELEQKNQALIIVKTDHNCGPEDASFDARNARGIRIDPWL